MPGGVEEQRLREISLEYPEARPELLLGFRV